MQTELDTVTSTDVRSDVEIMRAAQSDSRQFALIYEKYFQRIYMYCLRQVANPDEAEDLCSHVFIYAFRGLQNYRGGSVPAWLFRIAYGTVMNHLRSTYNREIAFGEDAPELASEIPSPLEKIMEAESHQHIRELIAGLTPEEQQLLSLKMDAGLTSQEIGELLDKKPGAVRTQLHRIIKRLRVMYRKTEERK